MIKIMYFVFLASFWDDSMKLTLCSSIIMILIFMKFYFSNSVKISTLVTFSTLLFILSNHMWFTYIFYELAMIPMVIMIISGGLNPYRFNAFLFMMFYALIFSLPSFIILVLSMNSNLLLYINLISFYCSNISYIMIVGMFFVKTPVYLLHFWLPKAHVEASTLGSIILASVMLKSGTLGCLKLFMWNTNKLLVNKSYFLITTVVTSVSCIIQSDFKKLIALTSVVHMMMSVTLLCSISSLVKAFYIININHTIISALMFYFSGVLYKISGSRMIYLQSMMKFSLNYYIICMMVLLNLGVPPFYSFLGEVIYFSQTVSESYLSWIFIMFIIMSVTLYSLLLLNNMKYFNSLKINLSSLMMYLGGPLLLMSYWALK